MQGCIKDKKLSLFRAFHHESVNLHNTSLKNKKVWRKGLEGQTEASGTCGLKFNFERPLTPISICSLRGQTMINSGKFVRLKTGLKNMRLQKSLILGFFYSFHRFTRLFARVGFSEECAFYHSSFCG